MIGSIVTLLRLVKGALLKRMLPGLFINLGSLFRAPGGGEGHLDFVRARGNSEQRVPKVIGILRLPWPVARPGSAASETEARCARRTTRKRRTSTEFQAL